jgi:hypothetical protein
MNNEQVLNALAKQHPKVMSEEECKVHVLNILNQVMQFHKKVWCKAKVEVEGSRVEKWVEISPKSYILWTQELNGGVVYYFRFFGTLDDNKKNESILYFLLKCEDAKWVLQFVRNEQFTVTTNLIMPEDIEKQNCADMLECLTLAFLVFSRGVVRCEREYHDFKEQHDRLLQEEGVLKKKKIPKKPLTREESTVFKSGFQLGFEGFGRSVENASAKIGFEGSHMLFNGEKMVSLDIFGEVAYPLQFPMRKEVSESNAGKTAGDEDWFSKSVRIKDRNNRDILSIKFLFNATTGMLQADWGNYFIGRDPLHQFRTVPIGLEKTERTAQLNLGEMKAAIEAMIHDMLFKFQEELVERKVKKES